MLIQCLSGNNFSVREETELGNGKCTQCNGKFEPNFDNGYLDKKYVEFLKKKFQAYPMEKIHKHTKIFVLSKWSKGRMKKELKRWRMVLDNEITNHGGCRILVANFNIRKLEMYLDPMDFNPESVKIKRHRKFKSRHDSRHIPSELRHAVFVRDKYKCRECCVSKDESPLEIDHIIAVSKGGTNDINNLQSLCKKCNRAKYTRTWMGGSLDDEDLV